MYEFVQLWPHKAISPERVEDVEEHASGEVHIRMMSGRVHVVKNRSFLEVLAMVNPPQDPGY